MFNLETFTDWEAAGVSIGATLGGAAGVLGGYVCADAQGALLLGFTGAVTGAVAGHHVGAFLDMSRWLFVETFTKRNYLPAAGAPRSQPIF